MKISVKHILFFSFVVVLMFSSCSTNEALTKSQAESYDQVAAVELLSPTFTPVPTMMSTPIIDVSEWIVTVGILECTLELYGDEFPGWFTLTCPEQLWFPIGQTTTIELNLLDSETCTISPIDDFDIVIQGMSIDTMPVEFIQVEGVQWGCQVPFSDTAGIEVVCGFRCEGDEIGVIVQGKTIRVNRGGGDGSEGGQIFTNPPVCGPAGCNPGGPITE